MESENLQIIDKMEIDIAFLYKRSDGIMRFEIKKGIVFEPPQVEKLVAALGKLGEGKKFGNLFLLYDDTDVTDEGRKSIASESATRYTIADAYVIASFFQKIIANFFLKVNKPPKPTKFFYDEKEAITWLRRQIATYKKESLGQIKD